MKFSEFLIEGVRTKAGDAPRAVLKKVLDDECTKLNDQMPKFMAKRDSRKPAIETALKLQNLIRLSDVKKTSTYKRKKGSPVKAMAFSIEATSPANYLWHFRARLSKEDNQKTKELTRKVLKNFIDVLENEHDFNFVGANNSGQIDVRYPIDEFEIFNPDKLKLADEYSDSSAFFFEPLDQMLSKREVSDKIAEVLRKYKVDSHDSDFETPTGSFDIENYFIILPSDTREMIKVFAGIETSGHELLASIIDNDEVHAMIDDIKKNERENIAKNINKHLDKLKKLQKDITPAITNINSYSPFPITMQISEITSNTTRHTVLNDYVSVYISRRYNNDISEDESESLKHLKFLTITIGDKK
jgi:hypothetical protein